MVGLAERLDEARAEVQRLERQAAQATCIEMGRHDLRLMGGRNAGCDDDCCCSVPVYVCSRCGDCDYGDGPEARKILASCKSRNDLSGAREIGEANDG